MPSNESALTAQEAAADVFEAAGRQSPAKGAPRVLLGLSEEQYNQQFRRHIEVHGRERGRLSFAHEVRAILEDEHLLGLRPLLKRFDELLPACHPDGSAEAWLRVGLYWALSDRLERRYPESALAPVEERIARAVHANISDGRTKHEALRIIRATLREPEDPAATSAEGDRGSIALFGPIQIADQHGRAWQVRASLEAKGYVPDVYLRLDGPVGISDHELWDDDVFRGRVMQELCGLGYDGPRFGRAELGMQSLACVVLEPNYEFKEFAVRRFGWLDLEQEERERGAASAAPGRDRT